jgi:NADH-quinone oxidoreductase subunit B
MEYLPEREYTEISEGKAPRLEGIRPLKRTYVFERKGMPPASQTDVGWIPADVKKKLKEEAKAKKAADKPAEGGTATATAEADGQKNGSPEEPADPKGTA